MTCHNQLDAFLEAIDSESGMPFLDVLGAHVAMGFGINVGVQVQHPAAEGRVEQDASLTAAQISDGPKLVLVP